MSSIQDRQRELVQEFKALETWEQRYQRIIEMGRALPPLPSEKKDEDHKVKGCQSQVWLHANLKDRMRVDFEGDSDALIARGLVALLLRVYSGASPDEILSTPPDFIAELGLQSKLSPSRANGLFSMIKQILYYAQAYKMVTQS